MVEVFSRVEGTFLLPWKEIISRVEVKKTMEENWINAKKQWRKIG